MIVSKVPLPSDTVVKTTKIIKIYTIFWNVATSEYVTFVIPCHGPNSGPGHGGANGGHRLATMVVSDDVLAHPRKLQQPTKISNRKPKISNQSFAV